MPFVCEGIIVGIAEDADALVEHLIGIGLVSLPLGSLLPCDASVTHSTMEARLHRAVSTMVGCLGVAHVVERVPYLMRHAVTNRLAGGRIEPESADLIVVATAIAGPGRSVVHQHHHFILGKVRRCRIDKPKRVEFQVEEGFALGQQVVDVDIVEAGCLRRRSAAIVLIPEHDDVVGFLRARLRPRVLIVGVVLGIE